MSLQIEKNLLTMFCASKEHLHTCLATGLKPNHFNGKLTREIFKACVELDDELETFDWVTIAEKVTKNVAQDKTEDVVKVLSDGNYLKVELLEVHSKGLIERSSTAQFLDYLNRTVESAQTPGFSIKDSLPKVIDHLSSLLDGHASDFGLRDIESILAEQVELMQLRESGDDQKISTGLPKLDRLIGGGLRPGKLVVVAGRPASGKSVFAQHLATQACKQGKTSFVFSLEMPAVELADRLIASQGQISLYDIQNPPDPEDSFWPAFSLGIERARNGLKNLFIDENPKMTVQAIIREAKRMSTKVKPDVIVIDYLSLIESDSEKDQENEAQRIGGITRYLKNASKEMGCCIILLAQFNRQADGLLDRRPTAAMLKGSGAIEQDADLILGIHRPGASDQNHDDPTLAEILVLKVRNGSLGTQYASFLGHTQSFEDRGEWVPPAVEQKGFGGSRRLS